jgi:hypothetical protein
MNALYHPDTNYESTTSLAERVVFLRKQSTADLADRVISLEAAISGARPHINKITEDSVRNAIDDSLYDLGV